MKLVYSQHRSEIIEFLYAPFIVKVKPDDRQEVWSQKQRLILKEAFLVQKQLESIFEDMSEQLSTYLLGSNFGFLHFLYFELLEEGKDPETIEEACHLLANVSQDKAERAIRFALAAVNQGEYDEKASLITILERTDMKAEDKWKWFQAIRRPIETVREQVELVAAVAPMYRPYYEQFQQQRLIFARHFSYEKIYGEHGLYKSSGVEELNYNEIQFCVLSPWLTQFSYIYNRHYQIYPVILCASVDIDQMLLTDQLIDEDLLTTTLKIMSDETRYKVMVALTKPHAKSKDIAEQLAITGAAVSFHTQKLINAKLLLFNSEDKTIKFDANKKLLRDMIAKLEEDFEL